MNVFVKPSAEGKSRRVCTMPRRENDCCEETNPFKFGTIVEGDFFTDRVEETAMLL